MGNLREKHCEPEPCSQPTLSLPLPLLLYTPCRPRVKLEAASVRCSSGLERCKLRYGTDRAPLPPTPAFTQCCCCWQGRVSILWACAPLAASLASTASTARQGVELNQLSLKVCKLVMHRRGAEMGAWLGSAWLGVPWRISV